MPRRATLGDYVRAHRLCQVRHGHLRRRVGLLGRGRRASGRAQTALRHPTARSVDATLALLRS